MAQNQEEFLLLRRRHWFPFFLEILPFLILFFFVLLLISFFSFSSPSFPQFINELFPVLSQINLKFLILFLLSLFGIILLFAIFLAFAKYYLTCWVVTTKRVISFEFLSLFNLQSSSIPLDKIQDLVSSLKGYFQVIFNYGDLRIETAGELGKFVMKEISEPEIVKKVIFEAQSDL